MSNLKFSVIIPVKQFNHFLEENINSLLKNSYKNFEVIVISDNKENTSFPKTKIIPSGKTGPAEKRDLGAKIAKGEILAFIDDDAYPSRDWLKNALILFRNKNIAAVCGPGITPPGDNISQKVSGWINSTKIGLASNTHRFTPEKERFVDDYPSMNLIIRKDDFMKLGGFDTDYWPGEDTKLCFDITRKLKKKIIYHPSVLVYHHRRPIFNEHLLQNGRYGLHRGYFARKLPATSFRLSYFPPSILLLSIILLPIFYILGKRIFYLDLFCILIYLFAILFTSVNILFKERNIPIALLFIPAIITTHLFYGLRFIQGFVFTRNLKR